MRDWTVCTYDSVRHAPNKEEWDTVVAQPNGWIMVELHVESEIPVFKDERESATMTTTKCIKRRYYPPQSVVYIEENIDAT